MMKVCDLIELLKNYPQDIPVAYSIYSEYCLMEYEDIVLRKLQPARGDGWVHSERPDKPSIQYLVFPGN